LRARLEEKRVLLAKTFSQTAAREAAEVQLRQNVEKALVAAFD
jgi:hypothetical protein